MPPAKPQIALLIDADNASPAALRAIIVKLERYGSVDIRRAYGNWEKSNLHPWKEKFLEHSVRPVQQYDYSRGKNATDIALAIDAMELSYTKQIDLFAIVSSDSDFTPLVMHLRERSFLVYGFGESKTPRPFAHACSGFFVIPSQAKNAIERQGVTASPTSPSIRSPLTSRVSPPPPTKPEPQSKAPQSRAPQSKAPQPATKPTAKVPGEKLKQNTRLVRALRQAIAESATANGWSTLAAIGNRLQIQPKQYGYSKLSALIAEIDLFETRLHAKVWFVRCKPSKVQRP